MIELEFYIPLSPEAAWEQLIQPVNLHKWWGKDVDIEPAKRGRFTESWSDKEGKRQYASGTVTAFEPGYRLQLDYRRHDWPRPTRLEFLFSPEKPGARLYLQHSGWDAIRDETERRKEVDAYAKIWGDLMEKFIAHCSK